MRVFFIIGPSLIVAISLMLALPASAENPTPYSGTQVIDVDQPFKGFLARLKKAIKANKMGIVASACADCGARAIGVSIPGNRVVMIYHPRFAVRMLKASVPAGIEAPLRLYVTQHGNKSRLTYRLPSHVFAPYGVPALDAMAAELDGIIAKIVEQATR